MNGVSLQGRRRHLSRRGSRGRVSPQPPPCVGACPFWRKRWTPASATAAGGHGPSAVAAATAALATTSAGVASPPCPMRADGGNGARSLGYIDTVRRKWSSWNRRTDTGAPGPGAPLCVAPCRQNEWRGTRRAGQVGVAHSPYQTFPLARRPAPRPADWLSRPAADARGHCRRAELPTRAPLPVCRRVGAPPARRAQSKATRGQNDATEVYQHHLGHTYGRLKRRHHSSDQTGSQNVPC